MISVVVIGRNEAARLGACMEAIHASLGVLSHEIVYVDSHSTDDSVAIAKRTARAALSLKQKTPRPALGAMSEPKKPGANTCCSWTGTCSSKRAFAKRP